MQLRERLGSALSQGNPVRLIGAHDGMSAVLADKLGFDGIWAGGLGISVSRGIPDNGSLTMTERHRAAAHMREVTDLPIVADVDSGFGDETIVRRMTRLYEAAGIDAVCIEDKEFPKQNSFLPGNVLAGIDKAARRIAAAKTAQRTSDFGVVARLESLIVGAGMEDAVRRACVYRDAGADAVLIHSAEATAHQIRDFCMEAKIAGLDVPVFAIPTTYPSATAHELGGYGVAAVVYANQLIRASVRAMQAALEELAFHGTTSPIEPKILSLSDLFALVGMGKRAEVDLGFEVRDAIAAVGLPEQAADAAGAHV